MEGLRQWLLGIVLTAFAAGLARQLAPEGREQAAVRLVGGLLLILAMLGPLGRWDWEELALPAGSFPQAVQDQTADYEAERTEALGAIIAENTAAYIWDKAEELGIPCTVEVTVAVGESGLPLPDTAIITGAYSGELAALIQEEVGIPAEKQIWREESVWSGKKENG